jgi:hypothetical protein
MDVNKIKELDKRDLLQDDFKILEHAFILVSSESADEKETLKTLALLKREYVDIYVNRQHEETLLMWAVWYLKPSIVEKLLEMGASVSYRNRNGYGPENYFCIDRLIAKKEEGLNVIYLLYQHGADLSHLSKIVFA